MYESDEILNNFKVGDILYLKHSMAIYSHDTHDRPHIRTFRDAGSVFIIIKVIDTSDSSHIRDDRSVKYVLYSNTYVYRMSTREICEYFEEL